MELTAWIIVFAGVLVFVAHLFAAIFERTRIPDVLPLVLVGIVVGPLTGLLSPESLGRVGNVFTTTALVLILFEGGLDLDFAVLGRSMSGAVRLAVGNVALTTLGVGLVGFYAMDLEPLTAAILGVIAGATSSAVVIPLVRRLRVGSATRSALVLESALSDVVCIVLVLGLVQAGTSEGVHPGALVGRMIASLLLAALIGAAAGILWASLLDHVRRLQTSVLTTLAFVFVVFGVTELLGYSGVIAALTLGIVLGNTEGIHALAAWIGFGFRPVHLHETEKSFVAEIVFVIKTFFFVFIGISTRFEDVDLLLAGLALAVLTLPLRLPVVWLAMGRKAGVRNASIAAVMIPKGLAAAVLASLAVEAGIPQGNVVREVAYAMILFSIVLTTMLSFLVEKGWLQRPMAWIFPEPPGVAPAPATLSNAPPAQVPPAVTDTAAPPSSNPGPLN